MKYAYLSLGMILVGMFGLVFIVMFEDVTVNNESEYYVLKEAMEASMLESVDYACYRIGDGCGNHDIKILEQKFVENFTRRFAASINGNVSEYEIQFYDIMEMPPKATVVIRGRTQSYILSTDSGSSSFDLTNNLSGILELYNE